MIAESQVIEAPICVPSGSRAYHWLAWTQKSLAQVLLGPEMGSRTMHFDALRREVQLAARFNSERLVQVRSSSIHALIPSRCRMDMTHIRLSPRICTNGDLALSLPTRRLSMSAVKTIRCSKRVLLRMPDCRR